MTAQMMRPRPRPSTRCVAVFAAGLMSLPGCGGDGSSPAAEEDPAYVEARAEAKAVLEDIETALDEVKALEASEVDAFGPRLEGLRTRLEALSTEGDHPIAIDRARDRLEILTKLHGQIAAGHAAATKVAQYLQKARVAVDAGDRAAADQAFAQAEKHALILKGTKTPITVDVGGEALGADAVLIEIRRSRAAAISP